MMIGTRDNFVASDAASGVLPKLIVVVLVCGVLARLIYLSADPHYSSWIGYITDEGRWVENARSLYLDGSISATGTVLHFIIAPLFQLVSFVIFEAAGLSRAAARLFPALCGVALIVVFWAMLRKQVGAAALIAGLTFLALQPDLVALSRIAIPEMPVLLCQLLVYLLVTTHWQARWKPILVAGVLTIGVALKATMALFFPVVIAMYLAQAMWNSGDRGKKLAEMRNFIISAGVVAVVVAGLVLFSLSDAALERLDSEFHRVAGFVQPSSPYSMATFFLDGELAPSFGLVLLGIWLCCLAWLADGGLSVEPRERRLVIGAAAWFATYLAVMLVLDYFPLRYQVHILVPMTILLTIGIHWKRRAGPVRLVGGARPVLQVLPAAIFLAPLVVEAAAWLGFDSARVTTKAAAVLLVCAAVATGVWANRQVFVRFAPVWLAFPFIAAIAHTVLSTTTWSWTFWPGNGLHAPQWTLFLAASATVAVLLTRTIEKHRIGSTVIVAGAAVYGMTSILGMVPGYVPPHFTLQSVSRDLEPFLAGSPTVFVHRAEGMFIDNEIRYVTNLNWKAEFPDRVVAFESYFNDQGLQVFLQENYSEVRRYQLYVHQRYLADRSRAPDLMPPPTVVLYRLSRGATAVSPLPSE